VVAASILVVVLACAVVVAGFVWPTRADSLGLLLAAIVAVIELWLQLRSSRRSPDRLSDSDEMTDHEP
jgi:predicted outer membrane lipoprotein